MKTWGKAQVGIQVVMFLALIFFTAISYSETIYVTPKVGGALPGTETRITTAPGDQYDPCIAGNFIVYTDLRGDDLDVYYYDLSKNQEFPVIIASGDQQLTGVSSNGKIVYTDYGTADVLVYDINTQTSTNLTNSAHSNSVDPAIGGNLVAWTDDRDGNQEIYAKDLDTGEERRITDFSNVDQLPGVGNGTIVWQRCAVGVCDVWSYDWASEQTRQITNTTDRDERVPDIDGNRIVYQSAISDPDHPGQNISGSKDICMFDLITGVEKCISLLGDQANPHISGNFVSFDDQSGSLYHVGLCDLATYTVYSAPALLSAGQYLNDIDGIHIVYTDDRNGDLDIYMFTFNLPPSVWGAASIMGMESQSTSNTLNYLCFIIVPMGVMLIWKGLRRR